MYAWDEYYEILLEYCRIHGHCNVPCSLVCTVKTAEKERKMRLGLWLSQQRQLQGKKRLRKSRLNKLQQLVDEGKLSWVVHAREANLKVQSDNSAWDTRYEALVKYGEEYAGDCNVPQSFRCKLGDGNEVVLGLWLNNQRYLKKQDSLRSDRQTKLQQLVDEGKLDWSIGRTDDNTWNAKYNALVKYGNKHGGNCNVPISYKCKLKDGKEVMLGRWLHRQRQYKKYSQLNGTRLTKLQQLVDAGKLDWVVDRHDDEGWNARFEALLNYGKKHGDDCNVPHSYTFMLKDGSEVKLGVWLTNQRQFKYDGKLKEDRRTKVQQLVDQGKLRELIKKVCNPKKYIITISLF